MPTFLAALEIDFSRRTASKISAPPFPRSGVPLYSSQTLASGFRFFCARNSNTYCSWVYLRKIEAFFGKGIVWIFPWERILFGSFVGLQSAIMGKDYVSWNNSFTGVTSSFFICIDDQSIVEYWMQVNSSAFT